MMRFLTIICACSIVAVACTKKAAPSTSVITPAEKTVKASPEKPSEDYKPGESTSDTKKDNSTAGMDKTNTPVAPDAPQKESYEQMGSSIYSAKCTKCHAAKTVSNYTMRQWDSILKNMVPKAKLSNEEEEQVTAYIRSNAKQ